MYSLIKRILQPFARFPLKKEVNNPNAQLKEFFDSLISRHQKRVTRVIKNRDCSNPLSAINSFILTNKLVIYSIVNDIGLIQKLTHVKKNLEDFFNEKNCFLFLIPSKNYGIAQRIPNEISYGNVGVHHRLPSEAIQGIRTR